MYNIPVRKRKQTKEYPMTRKDFQLIADVIKAQAACNTCLPTMRAFALSMCVELKKTNNRFDEARFLKACGVA